MKTFQVFVADRQIDNLCYGLVALNADVPAICEAILSTVRRGRSVDLVTEGSALRNYLIEEGAIGRWFAGVKGNLGAQAQMARQGIGGALQSGWDKVKRVGGAVAAPFKAISDASNRMAVRGKQSGEFGRNQYDHKAKQDAFKSAQESMNSLTQQLGQLDVNPNEVKGIMDQLRVLVTQGLQAHNNNAPVDPRTSPSASPAQPPQGPPQGPAPKGPAPKGPAAQAAAQAAPQAAPQEPDLGGGVWTGPEDNIPPRQGRMPPREARPFNVN